MRDTIASKLPIHMQTTICAKLNSATLVLLPGMDGTGDLFDPLIRELPRDLSVLVVRYPTQDALDYSQLESIAEGLLPKDRQLILIGESFSGPIAIALAARLGDRVTALVLCCTFAQSPSKILARIAPLSRLAPFEFIPNWVSASILLGSNATPKLRDLLRTALHKVSPTVLRGRLREIARVNVASQLPSCEVPILYLRATRDALVRSTSLNQILALRPLTRVVNLDGPHCLLQTSPALSANAILDFIEDVEQGKVLSN